MNEFQHQVKLVRVNRIWIFLCLGQSRVKASIIWGVIRPHIKMHQKFRSRDFQGVVPQKETLVQHQKYTWLLLIRLEYLVGINLLRGDTICIMHYIYTTEGHRKSFLTPHKKKKGIKTSNLPTLSQKHFS